MSFVLSFICGVVPTGLFLCSFSCVVAVVNEYAIKGLEKVEENLPILQQPADKVKSRLTCSACNL